MNTLGYIVAAIGAFYLIALLVVAVWMKTRKRPDEDTTENGHE